MSRHCVRLRDASVRLEGLQPAGLRILAALDQVAQALLRDIILTSVIRKGDAGAHGRGTGVDARIADWPDWQIRGAYQMLRAALGPDFTVLYEIPDRSHAGTAFLQEIAYVSASATAPHFHIQLRRDLREWPTHSSV